MEYSDFLNMQFAKWQKPSSSARTAGFLCDETTTLRIHPNTGFEKESPLDQEGLYEVGFCQETCYILTPGEKKKSHR